MVRARLVTSLILVGFTLAATHAFAAPAQWIVAPAHDPRARAIAEGSGARQVDPVLGIWVAPAPQAHRLAARLRARGLLRHSEPDIRTVPTDLRANDVAAEAAAGAWWRPRILGAAGEAPVGPAGAAAAPVAIIEDGFDPSIPDIPASVTLRRAPRIPDPVAAAERIAHGTMVASVIAGRGPRVFGVNPGSEVRVYGSTGFCSDTAAAIRRAISDGAKVVNMSYGFPAGSACLTHEEATSRGSSFAVMVAAAGNERAQPWMQPGNDLHILTVGSLNAVDQPTGFSHQGVHTDISAPGEGIGVACPLAADSGVVDGFCVASGTSFSAPMVAAVAARIRAARPDLSANQVVRLLDDTAIDIGSRRGWDISTGYGLVNLTAALTERAPAHDYLEPNDDIEWVDGRHFRPDAPLLRTRKRILFYSNLDALKDPADVYPVWVGPRGFLRAKVAPYVGTVRIAIHYPSARSIFRRADRVTEWRRVQPGRTGQVTITNAGSRGRKVWVSVYLPKGKQLFTGYDITLGRG